MSNGRAGERANIKNSFGQFLGLFSPEQSGCRPLRLLRSDGIGHDRATLAKGLIRTDRRIARGLMLNLGIEFGTEQHNNGQYPQPNHETDDRAERAIGSIVIGEAG